jgi:hypothetical protein
VAAAQVVQKLHLGFFADYGVGTFNAHAGFVQLAHQALDRHFQHLSKLCNRYAGHDLS